MKPTYTPGAASSVGHIWYEKKHREVTTMTVTVSAAPTVIDPCRINTTGFPYSEFGGVIKTHTLYTQATLAQFLVECLSHRRFTFDTAACSWCVLNADYTMTFNSPALVNVVGDTEIVATYVQCTTFLNASWNCDGSGDQTKTRNLIWTVKTNC